MRFQRIPAHSSGLGRNLHRRFRSRAKARDGPRLTKAERSDLLRLLPLPLTLPAGVAEEIRAAGPSDPATRLIADKGLVNIVAAPPVPDDIAAWNLGRGESEVVACARSRPGSEVLIDDLHGRRCARYLGLPVRGTLGLILVAKQRGVIPAARPVIERLVACGMFLKKSTIDRVLQRLGE